MKNYSNYTREIKQNILAQFVYEHSLPFKNKPYIFVDLNGGRGEWEYPDGGICSGSPLLFKYVLSQNHVDYRGFVFENNYEYFTHLNKVLGKDPRITLIRGNNDDAEYIVGNFGIDDHDGIIYHDLCKPTEMKFFVAEQATTYTDLDVLIHLSATDLKRILSIKERYPYHYNYEPFTLSKVVESVSIRDRHIYISGPYGPRQWTFLLSSRSNKKYENFVELDSNEGKNLYNKALQFKETSSYMIDLKNKKIEQIEKNQQLHFQNESFSIGQRESQVPA